MRHDVRLTGEKIARRLALVEPLVYRSARPLAPFRYLALPGPDAPCPAGTGVDDSAWELIAAPAYWSDWDTTFTLRTRFAVPAEWGPPHPVALYLPLGRAHDFSHPEALLYLDGKPFAAADRHHQEVTLPDWVCDGAEHLIALHGWTGRNSSGLPAGTRLLMEPSALVQVDDATRSFVATARVAHGVATELDDQEPARAFLMTALDEAFNCLDLREPPGEAFYASVPEAQRRLVAGIERSGRPLDVELYATGHAHIDVAWLWTQQQTRRRSARTFQTVLRLMEEFPEYHFTQSQPQLYQFMPQDIRRCSRESGGASPRAAGSRPAECGSRRTATSPVPNRWRGNSCSGAVSSASILAKAPSRPCCGCRTCSATPDLPQLIKQAGLQYFFTTKINWNRYNRLPYDSFWWEGLDGTRVLAHFSTTPDGGALSARPTMRRPRRARRSAPGAGSAEGAGRRRAGADADGVRLRRRRRRTHA